MRPARVAVAVFVLVAMPGWASAYEAFLGVRAGVGYESNIFQTTSEVADAVYTIRPLLRLTEQTPRFDGTLYYDLLAEFFQNNSSANGLNHLLTMDLEYELSSRSRLTFSDNFASLRNLERLDIVNEPTEVETGSRTTTNRLNTGYIRNLTPRWDWFASVSHFYRDSDRQGDQPLQTFTGNTSLTYRLTPLSALGVGVRYDYTSIADAESGGDELDARRSNAVNAYIAWTRQWTRHWLTQIQLGPAWVRSTRTLRSGLFEVPVITPIYVEFDQSFDSDNFTGFGRASLTRLFDRGEASLTYQRSLSAVSTIGADTTVDALFLFLKWDSLDDKWSVLGRAGWNRRESLAAEQAGGAVSNIAPIVTQYSFFAQLQRALTRQFAMGVAFRYLNQQSEGALNVNNSFDNFEVRFIASYNFKPLTSLTRSLFQ